MNNVILIGHVIQKLKEIPDQYINTCVTSPPYWGLRDYNLPPIEWPDGWIGCLGLEPTPEMYVSHIVMVFREVKRVLRDDGTLWLNLGDNYVGSASEHRDIKSFGKNSRISEAGKIAQSGVAREGRKERGAGAVKSGLKPKDLVGIPWMVAFALRADGWYLRQDIIWAKPNPMPESVKDRCTKAHEYIFLLSKSAKYYYDYEAIKEPANPNTNPKISKSKIREITKQRKNGNSSIGCDRNYNKTHEIDGMIKQNTSYENAVCLPVTHRNKRSVWTVSTKPFSGAHFATFPPDLIKPCILAGCPKGGIVLDTFGGSGTTGRVSLENGRNYILIELKPEYTEMSENRIKYDTVDPEEIELIKKQLELFLDIVVKR